MGDYFSRKYPILKFNKVDPRREKLSIETDRLLIRYTGQLSAKVGLETLETSNSASRLSTDRINFRGKSDSELFDEMDTSDIRRLETLFIKIEVVRINSNEHV